MYRLVYEDDEKGFRMLNLSCIEVIHDDGKTVTLWPSDVGEDDFYCINKDKIVGIYEVPPITKEKGGVLQ